MNAAHRTELATPTGEEIALFQQTYYDAVEVTRLLGLAQSRGYHLVTPALAIGAIPDGFGIAFSPVWVNPDMKGMAFPMTGSGDDEDAARRSGGRYLLGKASLDLIASAAGISWRTERVDDGKRPFYWHCRAIGTVPQFDGSERVIEDDRELDAAEGSPLMKKIFADAEARKANRRNYGNPERELREIRVHGLAMCTTKARLRAVRGLGLLPSYSREDLCFPFVVVKRVLTGESKDPETKRALTMMMAEHAAGARVAAWGARGRAEAAAPPRVRVDVEEPAIEEVAPPARPAARAAAPPAPPPAARPERAGDQASHLEWMTGEKPAPSPPSRGAPSPMPGPAKAAPARAQSGHVMPGGPSRGMPIEFAPIEDVKWWAGYLADKIEDGTTKDPQKDPALVAALVSEIRSRAKIEGAGR